MMTEHLLLMQEPTETCNWKETAGHCGNSIRPADTITGVTGSRKEQEDIHNELMDAAYFLVYGEHLEH